MRAPRSARLVLSVFLFSYTSSINAFSLPRWTETITLRAGHLWRRQDNNDKIPSAISIAPSQYWEGNDGPWSTFPLQVGTGAENGLQNVRVLPSTAATNIWTIGAEGCPNDFVYNCPNSRGGLFLRNQSLTWAPDSVYETALEMNLGLDSSGYVGFDVATLGWQGSSAEASDQHSVIFNMADPRYWIGIFGLNPRPTNFTDFSNPQTSFMQTLFDNGQIPSVSYGYTAGNQYRSDSVYSSLTLGGYDKSRLIENDVTFPFYPDISRDLSVNLHSIQADTAGTSNLLPDGSISIFIDTTVPELWLPESACAAFEQAFGISYNDTIGRYLVSSSQRRKLLTQNAEITLTMGPQVSGGDTVDIKMPYQAFDLQLGFPIMKGNTTGPSYYFPLQKAANETQYTLGRAFLQEAYVIADYDHQNFSVSQCDWSQDAIKKQNVVSILSPQLKTTQATSGDNSDKHKLSTGIIAGIAIGIVALIALLGLILFFLRRRKMKQRRLAAEAEAEKNASTATLSKSDISNPMGGELGSHDVYEAPMQRRPHEVGGGGIGDLGKFGYSEMDGKGFRAEVYGCTPVYEMQGSDVHEMGSGRRSRPVTREAGFF